MIFLDNISNQEHCTEITEQSVVPGITKFLLLLLQPHLKWYEMQQVTSNVSEQAKEIKRQVFW